MVIEHVMVKFFEFWYENFNRIAADYRVQRVTQGNPSVVDVTFVVHGDVFTSNFKILASIPSSKE